MALKTIKLEELIEQVLEVNTELKYGLNDVKGMTLSKEIIPTKADINPKELPKFTIVSKYDFIFNPRTHGKKIGFGFNEDDKKFLISWNNIAFRVKEDKQDVLLPYYLWIWLKRDEWDRFATFNSWGSSTEVFSWDSLCDMSIELPDLATQQKYVNVYLAMIENQKAYERGLDDLKLVCDAYIEDLRRKMPCEEIGKYIEIKRTKNSDEKIRDVYGVSNTLKFITASSVVDKDNLSNYKIVEYQDIAYVPTTHMKIWAAAISDKKDPFVVSPIYEVFRVKNKDKLLPEYLFLWLCRSETIRYAFYNSWGSARENFVFDDMCTVKMPIPDIKIQQAVVDIYKCYQKRKEINERLKNQIKDICPILIKGSINEGR